MISLIFLIINSNSYKNQRKNQLRLKLTEAKDVEECKYISEKIVELGPECYRSFGTWHCTNLVYYSRDMISCISSVAVSQNNQSLCSNNELNKEICVKSAELFRESSSGFGFDIANFSFTESQECINSVEKSCILSFASKANSNTDVTLECDLYEEGLKKDGCFWLRSTLEQNPELCLMISNELERSWCLYYFAFKNHNKTLCDYCTESEKKDCESDYDFIEKIDEISDCDNYDSTISSGDDECYLAFAIYNNDSAVCSKYKPNKYVPISNEYTIMETYNICMRYTK